MTEEQDQPVVVRAQGRPDGRELPVIGALPYPGEHHPGVGVRWVEDGALLAVTTWGSSSHPTVPRAARVQDGELTLTIGRRETAPLPPGSVDVMTADLASYTTLIEPPTGLDLHSTTRVHVGDQVVELLPAGTPPPPPIPLLSGPSPRPPSPHSGPPEA
ncbi:hypothetical protein [Modestobacter sp. VKM Ac-2985]|uniref:hypothetical protein n=1 Tax=Modestobacter sp. VKM Ac-2985 TaxID=3004139 RepID=UPI0022AB7CFB|nr:hypothetical protein [Modestobacter sp. VKM Ac-2985]MCZ2837528.1 hypothetical protein [Modestobacter sp. VKM Ac-2985]